jgi:hypothetical protein
MRAFNPWVGEHYRDSGLDGVKLLVLGESQYGSPGEFTDPVRGTTTGEDPSATREIIRDYAILRSKSFFTKILKVVLGVPAGEQVTHDQRTEFWNGVAFYNFIQWWMPKPKYPTTEEMWSEGLLAFSETLIELKPDVLLVLGRHLKNRLPPLTEVRVVGINHPSSNGFSYDPWSNDIRSALASTREHQRQLPTVLAPVDVVAAAM